MDGYTKAAIKESMDKMKPWQRNAGDFADWLLNKTVFPYVVGLLFYVSLLSPLIYYFRAG